MAAAQTQKKMNKTNARSGKIVKSVQSERASNAAKRGEEKKMYSSKRATLLFGLKMTKRRRDE